MMRFLGWLRRPEQEEASVTDEQEMMEASLLSEVELHINALNEAFPALLVFRPRLSLWVDRTERPYRLQLCDWEDSFPNVIAGGR